MQINNLLFNNCNFIFYTYKNKILKYYLKNDMTYLFVYVSTILKCIFYFSIVRSELGSMNMLCGFDFHINKPLL